MPLSPRRAHACAFTLLAATVACGNSAPALAPQPATTPGCDASTLFVRPDEPSTRGPWAVGARTLTLAGLTVEAWYPAQWGSDRGHTKVRYDLRPQLPEAERGKIPDAQNPWQACDCYRDLPIDATRGPYPLVLFLHGLGGFRTQSATMATHWASRGFVVVSADHPGVKLGDVLVGRFGGDQAMDAGKLLDALATPSGEAAFLAGRLLAGRIGVVGHSAGGSALKGLGARAGVQVLVPMASGGVEAGAALQSTLILGGKDDATVPYTRQQSGYASAPPKKRLVGLRNAGHLAFSDICVIGREQGGILAIARQNGVSVPDLFANLATDGCRMGQLPAEEGWRLVHHATAAALEETLHCQGASAASKLSALRGMPNVDEFLEAP